MFENPGALDNHQRIQISKELYIEYDPDDTWVTIADENWFEYDRPGGVILGIAEIDGLIKALLEAKQNIMSDSKKHDLRELLADLCHKQWSGWMEYLFSKGTFNDDGTWTMPFEYVDRWQRQLNTSYAQLSESEQESDRKEADKFLTLLAAACRSDSERRPPESGEDSGDGSAELI